MRGIAGSSDRDSSPATGGRLKPIRLGRMRHFWETECRFRHDVERRIPEVPATFVNNSGNCPISPSGKKHAPDPVSRDQATGEKVPIDDWQGFSPVCSPSPTWVGRPQITIIH
jgi:hypothetical protein